MVMDKLLVSYLTINSVGLAILLIIYLFMRKRSEIFAADQKIFINILVANAIIIILDTAEWYLDGKTTELAVFLLNPVYVLYYIMNPVLAILWFLYVYLNVHENFKKLKWQWVLIFTPFVINIILSILSYQYNIFFIINEDNVYIRGKFFHIETLITYGYLLASVVLVLINRKKFKREKVLPLILYVAIPALVGSLQILVYGLNLIWISSSIAALIVFISLQSRSLLTDYLTGAYNRHHLENYLNWRIKSNHRHYIAGIMIDIDKFKDINDQYGHIAGDNALEATATILRKSIEKKDFLARYAGDEFVIILESSNRNDIDKVLDRLEKNLRTYNQRPEKRFDISLSHGFHVFDPNDTFDFKCFIDTIDQKMYQNKRDKYEKLNFKR